MGKVKRPNIVRDKFWNSFVDAYVNDAGYWYQPKGLVVSQENLGLIKKRLRELARLEGKPWKHVQHDYTKSLVDKGLVNLRKAPSRYTAADFSAISRMNKVVFNTLGLAWIDKESTVFVTDAGRAFIKQKDSSAIVKKQVGKYQFGNPSLGEDTACFRLFPHLFLLDVLLAFPKEGISRQEYILFVSRAKSNEDLDEVIDRIKGFRSLSEEDKASLAEYLSTIPIIKKGRVATGSRRSSIFNTIQLNAPYSLSFLAFPDYMSLEPSGRILIPPDQLKNAVDVARQQGSRAFYTEFASEKDWFSHYGDMTKSGSELDAMEYYESRSDIDNAVRAFLVARSRGTAPKIECGDYMELRVQEKMLEDLLEFNLHLLEKGLTLIGRQYQTLVGPIDLLAIDSNGDYVVIELKKSRAGDRVIGQIQRYRGYILQELARSNQRVRGMIVSRTVDKKLKYAVRALQAEPVQLFQFEFHADVQEVA
jgi:hypothetical protein